MEGLALMELRLKVAEKRALMEFGRLERERRGWWVTWMAEGQTERRKTEGRWSILDAGRSREGLRSMVGGSRQVSCAASLRCRINPA